MMLPIIFGKDPSQDYSKDMLLILLLIFELLYWRLKSQ